MKLYLQYTTPSGRVSVKYAIDSIIGQLDAKAPYGVDIKASGSGLNTIDAGIGAALCLGSLKNVIITVEE
jgi:hypothetical protein